ncbi:putative glucose transporter HXT5 [Wickerhamomyces ciferrii]|uniref:Glucose transporter HXT5 n=1 Tax=Wickerhamomyces ciferrii (strain ATCC 14091 / BCRC 22168 / CBS 111 / JCM 3599 / NBRC 0793 / NRRL Y-1031 F-60-10) TaxID=1206466 RepID=K0KTK5_WICCF|nr:putative glucose transporter HXT5 [Wickerhamomyces ciferrii]CCH46501.1 putative glucose transporter HXT5 [Wickerhamomyces ciferrii]
MAYQKPYSKLNFISFALACFFNISFMVFMSSTQSFFLTDILGISSKIGDYIGTLGFADELMSIALSPFLGTLSDKIGPKYILVFGVFSVGLSFFIFTLAQNVYPDLLLIRLFFAIGATAAGSMMTALLAELSASGFQLSSLLNFKNSNVEYSALGDASEVSNTEQEPLEDSEGKAISKRNGKLTSVIGIASGTGAVFSVSVYLPLPTRFGQIEPPAPALKHSYFVVGGIALAASLFLSWGLFSNKTFKIPYLSKYLSPYDDVLDEIEREEHQVHLEEEKHTYFGLMKLGFLEAKDPKIALGYLGGFLSRSTTVVAAAFIPLYVNRYYYDNGYCSHMDRSSCKEAYVQAAILVGICHTVSLVFAPIFGYLADKHGRKNSMILACVLGLVGSFGFAFLKNPKSATAIVFSCFFGAGEIGSILVSLSLCTDKKRAHNGSISGVYSLIGGIGILLISKAGGFTADYWVGGPFIILGSFQIITILFSLYVGGHFDFIISKFTSSVRLEQ